MFRRKNLVRVSDKKFHDLKFFIIQTYFAAVCFQNISAAVKCDILSLGMVGALSIVRFRTAIKEPVEIAFLFWSLAIGIVIGAGMIPLALIGSAIIGIILLFFGNRKVRNHPYILVMNCADENAENAVIDILGKEVEYYIVKSKTISKAGIELTAELRTKNASTGFVNQISGIAGVENATLVSYNGEYMS